MNKIAIIAAVALASCGASPAYASSGDLANRDVRICPVIERLARTIMEGRQIGVSYSAAVASTSDSDAGKLARKLISMAHDEPRYNSQEYQQKAIDDFGNLIAAACHKRADR